MDANHAEEVRQQPVALGIEFHQPSGVHRLRGLFVEFHLLVDGLAPFCQHGVRQLELLFVYRHHLVVEPTVVLHVHHIGKSGAIAAFNFHEPG